ncbi:MAG: flagellar biosynthetic protein FliQ [Planctomycetes bacterium]|nr:flagellar biosynthetic protein FliQ [Planctomycetota bacterium]
MLTSDHGTLIAIEVVRDSLYVSLKLSLPLLVVGLVTGLVVSVLQALTQVQEQTLSFIPKILVVAGAMFVLMPWLLAETITYTLEVFRTMATRFPG